jgi:hypothetical protein
MSTFGGSSEPGGAAASAEDWKKWALAVFGGNDVRASAAAAAAAASRAAGASNDELFAAAQAAYENAGSSSLGQPQPQSPSAMVSAPADCTVRPSGRGALGITLIGILLVGIVAVLVRSGANSVVPVVGAAALIMGAWYALSLRSSVMIAGPNVCVQGVLHRREFRRLDIRQIAVQPRARQLGIINGPLRGQFFASFLGNDFAHLFELRQGAWTRTDIDRIGSAIGVQVVEDSTPSIT